MARISFLAAAAASLMAAMPLLAQHEHHAPPPAADDGPNPERPVLFQSDMAIVATLTRSPR